MARKKQKITVGGNIARPGQTAPRTIVLTQPRRFGIDIADVIQSVRAFDNVDYSRRYKLYDLYSDILMDPHLTSVIDKRVLAVLSSPIEFRRKGKVDEMIVEQLRSPWFRKAIKDIMWAQFWGFSLMQFYKDGEWLNYDLIPRKHVDPVRKLILCHQTDIFGTSWDEYAELLFVGSDDDMGLLGKAAPWVIYKRNTTADWAQFSEVFGMPIREYVYDTDDDEARQRAIEDAENTGGLAVLIHSKDSTLNLIESGNKTGSSDLYERLTERCNAEISKLILGNTLTTEASSTGTQALGTVHKKVEDRMTQADRQYVLDVLNYNMTDIFLKLGINTIGGEFFFPDPKEVDLTAKANMLVQLKQTFNLPIDDDYLYDEFGIEKPKNYDALKKEPQPVPTILPAVSGVTIEETIDNDEDDDNDTDVDDNKPQSSGVKPKNQFSNWFRSFFVRASQGGALDW